MRICAGALRATVVTNSLPIALELADHARMEVVVAPLTELTELSKPVTDATDPAVLAPYRALGIEVMAA